MYKAWLCLFLQIIRLLNLKQRGNKILLNIATQKREEVICTMKQESREKSLELPEDRRGKSQISIINKTESFTVFFLIASLFVREMETLEKIVFQSGLIFGFFVLFYLGWRKHLIVLLALHLVMTVWWYLGTIWDTCKASTVPIVLSATLIFVSFLVIKK